MTTPDPHSAEPGGQALAPSSDDTLRRLAAERLAEHLDTGAALIARCEELASGKRGDPLGPLYAAARLMRANAEVAAALARVAQVESRHRSVVETVPKPDPKFVAWQQEQRTHNPYEAFAALEKRLFAGVDEEAAKDAARDAEELRADTAHLDGPIYPPY